MNRDRNRDRRCQTCEADEGAGHFHIGGMTAIHIVSRGPGIPAAFEVHGSVKCLLCGEMTSDDLVCPPCRNIRSSVKMLVEELQKQLKDIRQVTSDPLVMEAIRSAQRQRMQEEMEGALRGLGKEE